MILMNLKKMLIAFNKHYFLNQINNILSRNQIKDYTHNTYKTKAVELYKSRLRVSDLIFEVLTSKTCVREALKSFPKDSEDPSVHCCWHALLHYEADEDQRRYDFEYKEEQDEYLEMLAFIMKEGKPIPVNIINNYKSFYEAAYTPKSQTFWGILKSLFRFII